MSIYSVRSGDTLSAIAARYNTTVDKLAQTNKIANPDLIYVDQKVKIPDGFDAPKKTAPVSNTTPTTGETSKTKSTTDTSSGEGAAAVENAKQFLGTPYNYGWDRSYTGSGTDPNGLGLKSASGHIDCSQLTSLAYGGKLPADCVTQGEMGPHMPVSQAKAGDIICFDEHGTGSASHVGIYDGHGNVVHASSYSGETTVTPVSQIDSFNTWAVRP